MIKQSLILIACLLPSVALSEAPDGAGRFEGPRGPNAGTCSAVLIAEDLILTAAHCGGGARPGGSFGFRAGGQQSDAIPVVASVVHPLYDLEGQGVRRFRFDLAVLRLEGTAPARPIETGPPAEVGERLHIATWKAGDGEGSRLRPCRVIPGRPGLVTLACAVEGGESGGAVLRSREDAWELVAILTSRGRQGDLPIAQATNVEGRLRPILQLLP